MKTKITLLLISILYFSVSCTNQKSNSVKEDDSEQSLIKEDEKTVTESEAAVPQNVKVYTGKELDDWLPEKIMEYVKMQPSSIGEEGFNHIEANYHYKSGYEKYVTLEITNGNSEKELRKKNSIVQRIEMNFSENSESGYTKVHKRNGIDVFEMQGDYNNSSTVEFIVNQRFYVKADGTGMKADEVWQLIEQLNFNTLN